MFTRRVTGLGVVTIPKEVREDMQLSVGDQIAFVKLDSGAYIITKADPDKVRNIVMVDPNPGYSASQQLKDK